MIDDATETLVAEKLLMKEQLRNIKQAIKPQTSAYKMYSVLPWDNYLAVQAINKQFNLGTKPSRCLLFVRDYGGYPTKHQRQLRN